MKRSFSPWLAGSMFMVAVSCAAGCAGAASHGKEISRVALGEMIGAKRLVVVRETFDTGAVPGGGLRKIKALFEVVVDQDGSARMKVGIKGRIDALKKTVSPDGLAGEFRPVGWATKGRWSGVWEVAEDDGRLLIRFFAGEQVFWHLPGFDGPSRFEPSLPESFTMTCEALVGVFDVPDSLVEELAARKRGRFMACSCDGLKRSALAEVEVGGYFLFGSDKGVSVGIRSTREQGERVRMMPREVATWYSAPGHWVGEEGPTPSIATER